MGTSLLTPVVRDEGGTLACEDVSLELVAARVGTPAYVYSSRSIRERWRSLTLALGDVPHRIHYSVKANGNLAILNLLRELGAGVDIVSGGELYRATRAGFRGRDVVFSGVGKTAQEIGEAIEAGVLLFNVESEAELRMIDREAALRDVITRVALRVNPEVDVETAHDYIGTGRRGDKFGIPYDEVRAVAGVAESLPSVTLAGLDMHVGSQLADLSGFATALERLRALLDTLRSDGHRQIEYLDVGGGLAVPYAEGDPAVDLEAYAALVREAVEGTGLTLLLEPGRFLVADAGVLLTRVLQRKRSGGKEYVIVDAGMTELLRPSHYDAYHEVSSVRDREGSVVADLVGPVCESGDFLALERSMPDVQAGDLMIVRHAGAYGFVMSSNYNARPRVAELMVDGDRWAVVRERESYEDLVRGEIAEPLWRR